MAGWILVASVVGLIGCSPARTGPASPGPQDPARVEIEKDFGEKVVYGVSPAAPVERLRADCERRGGTFNTCGSPCAPGTDICAQVCAFTCEGIGGAGAARSSSTTVALLDPDGQSKGPRRGCDTVAYVERQTPAADHPADAALQALFAIDDVRVNGLYNFIARTRDTLQIERVTVSNGTARVFLRGRISGLAGVCDNPRAGIQIEETLLRVPGVKQVEILLNGTPSDLRPSGL